MTFKFFLHNFAKKTIWLFPFILFLMGYYAIDICFYQSLIKTPSVIGKSLTEALEVLSHHNLNAKLLGYKEGFSTIPEGTVISQNPSELSSIRPQQTVFLIVSTIPKKQQTPECVGLSYSIILEQLKKQGIDHIAYHVASNYPQGICIAQAPAVSSKELEGQLLLYISKGNNCSSFLMPDLTDMPIVQIVDFLQKNNLPFTIYHSKETPPDHVCVSCKVVAQKPLPRSSVEKKLMQTIQLQVNN